MMKRPVVCGLKKYIIVMDDQPVATRSRELSRPEIREWCNQYNAKFRGVVTEDSQICYCFFTENYE